MDSNNYILVSKIIFQICEPELSSEKNLNSKLPSQVLQMLCIKGKIPGNINIFLDFLLPRLVRFRNVLIDFRSALPCFAF